jgi:hypothetical protein
MWLMDSGCSRHMTENKKLFSSLTPLSHKEYVTFGDDKKGQVLGTGVIKVNGCFTLNDVTLMDGLTYNLLSIFQLVDDDLSVVFCNSDSHVLDSSSKHVCGISHIENIFQADFSFAQSMWWLRSPPLQGGVVRSYSLRGSAWMHALLLVLT